MCLEFITRTEKSNKSFLDLITGKLFWLLKKQFLVRIQTINQ